MSDRPAAEQSGLNLIALADQGRVYPCHLKLGTKEARLLGGGSGSLWYVYVQCVCSECSHKPTLLIEDADADDRPFSPATLARSSIMSVVQFLVHCNPHLEQLDEDAELDIEDLARKHLTLVPAQHLGQSAGLYLDDALPFISVALKIKALVGSTVYLLDHSKSHGNDPARFQAATILSHDEASGFPTVRQHSNQATFSVHPALTFIHLTTEAEPGPPASEAAYRHFTWPKLADLPGQQPVRNLSADVVMKPGPAASTGTQASELQGPSPGPTPGAGAGAGGCHPECVSPSGAGSQCVSAAQSVPVVKLEPATHTLPQPGPEPPAGRGSPVTTQQSTLGPGQGQAPALAGGPASVAGAAADGGVLPQLHMPHLATPTHDHQHPSHAHPRDLLHVPMMGPPGGMQHGMMAGGGLHEGYMYGQHPGVPPPVQGGAPVHVMPPAAYPGAAPDASYPYFNPSMPPPPPPYTAPAPAGGQAGQVHGVAMQGVSSAPAGMFQYPGVQAGYPGPPGHPPQHHPHHPHMYPPGYSTMCDPHTQQHMQHMQQHTQPPLYYPHPQHPQHQVYSPHPQHHHQPAPSSTSQLSSPAADANGLAITLVMSPTAGGGGGAGGGGELHMGGLYPGAPPPGPLPPPPVEPDVLVPPHELRAVTEQVARARRMQDGLQGLVGALQLREDVTGVLGYCLRMLAGNATEIWQLYDRLFQVVGVCKRSQVAAERAELIDLFQEEVVKKVVLQEPGVRRPLLEEIMIKGLGCAEYLDVQMQCGQPLGV